MRDGTKIRISDMTNEHLINSINYFYRNREIYLDALLYALCVYSEDAPDGASSCADAAIDELLEDSSKDHWLSWLDEQRTEQLIWVVQEIQKRSLLTCLQPELVDSLEFQGVLNE